MYLVAPICLSVRQLTHSQHKRTITSPWALCVGNHGTYADNLMDAVDQLLIKDILDKIEISNFQAKN